MQGVKRNSLCYTDTKKYFHTTKKVSFLSSNNSFNLEMLSNKLPLFICFTFLLFYLSAINGSDNDEDYDRNFSKNKTNLIFLNHFKLICVSFPH